MRNLLCADLNRVRKDRLFTWIIVLAVVFGLIPLIAFGISCFKLDATQLALRRGSVDIKRDVLATMQMNDLLNYLAIIMVAMILHKDFGQGIIRNKLITGKSRVSVMLSMFATALIAIVSIAFTYALVMTGGNLVIRGFKDLAFSREAFWPFLRDLALSLNVFLFVAALVTYICVSSKNGGGVTMKYIATTTAVSILVMQLAVIGTAVDGGAKFHKVLEFIDHINVFGYNARIGMGSYEKKELAYLIATPPILSGMLLTLGWLKLSKKEIK